MKKLFLVLFFTTSLVVESFSQSGYVSLKECNNDTLKYMEVNFITHKDRYINQPFSKFTDEFELDIYLQSPFNGRLPDKSKYWGASMTYVMEDYYYWRDKRPLYFIYVEFERPYLKNGEDIHYSVRKSIPNLYRSLFKDQVIKDLEIRLVENDPRSWKEVDRY
ncbi:hypothetical protein [Bacteroides sp. 41_26]|uniref:hypothetical protein n=1 Tax=Bacteroides sp. 41_26 TaxID=1896973 RepID=UPI00259C6904|nr:hypothetical protein [Bacteroides sp. 41_26]